MIEFDDERDSQAQLPGYDHTANDPEQLLLRKAETARIDAAIVQLPFIFREVLILREMEEMSYDEISQVALIPVGTVMSRLSRARTMLRAALRAQDKEN